MNTTSTLKVRIPITVNIDVEAWNVEYGGGFETAAQIRADIKRHIEDMVQQQLDSLGVSAAR
jgi:hypothetical protein